jgi:hypothetical protein
MVGRELREGRYTIEARLGTGAQGETWRARDRKRGDRAVAIKAFRVGAARTWKDVELAEREARTLALLDHGLLPRYVEHFEAEGTLYLVMDLIEGASIAELRQGGVHFDAAEVERMLRDLGRALGYLHGRVPSVVHRDVKPGNVLRRRDGSFALVDFGAVRDRIRTEGGSTVVGTFGYMAPEQFQGRASPVSDVYGAGATALAMLTACEPEELPHEGLAVDVARAVPAGTPKPLVRALKRMLSPDPDRRASSIEQAFGDARLRDQREPEAGGRDGTATRRERHEARKRERRERRTGKRERKAARKSRRPRVPFLPRIVVNIALWVTSLVVWIAVGIVTPFVLFILSLFFGAALRRAAAACARAALATRHAMGRASGWLAGRDRVDGPRVGVHAVPDGRARVAPDAERVRVASPEDPEEDEAEDVRPAARR